MPNKAGFTLMELCLAIAVLSVLMLLSLPLFRLNALSEYPVIYDYLIQQSTCMKEQTSAEYYPTDKYVYYAYAIRFNSKGHVNQAQTLIVDDLKKVKEIVVELGGGRLVLR